MARRPWERKIYSVPERVDGPIYRGFALALSEAQLRDVLNPSRDAGERATQLVDLADARGRLCEHWSTSQEHSRFWSLMDAQSLGTGATGVTVVVCARQPDVASIEHDPQKLWELGVQGYITENEVPLVPGTSVAITSAEWHEIRNFYNAHQFFSAGATERVIVPTTERRTYNAALTFGM